MLYKNYSIIKKYSLNRITPVERVFYICVFICVLIPGFSDPPLTGHPPHQTGAFCLEPFFPAFVVGDHFGNLCPEAGRMVHFFSVAEFMYDHIIQNFGRREHQKTVKIEIAFCGTAPPACPLISDRDPAVFYTYNRGKEGHAAGDHTQGLIRECPDFLHCERRGGGFRFRGPLSFCHFQMLSEPAGVFPDKGFNFPQRCGLRSADDDLTVMLHLQRKSAPPAAPYDLYGIRNGRGAGQADLPASMSGIDSGLQ